MSNKRRFSTEEAGSIATRLKVDWSQIDPEQFRRGPEIELEHGAIDPETNVTGDDPLLTGKNAWAHLKEIKDCYKRLDQLEAETEAKGQAWQQQRNDEVVKVQWQFKPDDARTKLRHPYPRIQM